MTTRNSSRDAIIDELSKYGVKPLGTGHGGEHPYVEFATPNGMRVKIPHTTNGKEGHGRRLGNYRAFVRRHMVRLGIALLEPEIPIRSRPPIIDVIERLPRNPVRVPPADPIEQPRIAPQLQPKPQEKIMTEETKSRVAMTRLQIITAGRLLEDNSVEADGKRSYKEGWNDERIAQIVSATSEPKLKINHVAYLRREVYPDWRISSSPKGPTATQDARIVALEARVQALEDAATRPTLNGNRQHAATNGALHRGEA